MRAKTLELYNRAVALCPNFERKGKTMPYTSANGYMFSQVNKDGELGIRLPKAIGEAFKTEHQSTIFKSYGAVMKDYVLVPEHILNNSELLSSYLNEAYNYVMSLKAKPQKK